MPAVERPTHPADTARFASSLRSVARLALAALALALLATTACKDGTDTTTTDTSHLTSDAAYIKARQTGVTATALITVGETVSRTSASASDYRMIGIPDGLGLVKDGDGTIRLFMNHELGNTTESAPFVGGSVVQGAFVSEWKLKSSGRQVSGDIAFTSVMQYDPVADTFTDRTTAWQDTASDTFKFGRFCSGGFYTIGSDEFYITGEESGGSGNFDGNGGEIVAISGGVAYVLPEFGHMNFENAIVVPSPTPTRPPSSAWKTATPATASSSCTSARSRPPRPRPSSAPASSTATSTCSRPTARLARTTS
ncbi:MAG: hypothetical protein AB7K09_04095 [Planctomycetota bacterium]